MAPPRSLAALMEEMVEEVLLRLPPDDPKSLLPASLVCKRWRRIFSDRGFRRRFRDLHRAPPLLGMFSISYASNPRFIPTCSFRLSPLIDCSVLDTRHGRVLLYTGPVRYGQNSMENQFEIWNPITGKRKKLPILGGFPKPIDSWNAAVLRRDGQSLVVFVGTDRHEMFSYVYSSEAAAWSEQVSAPLPAGGIEPIFTGFWGAIAPSALMGNVLYFMIRSDECILKYDLGTQEMSLLDRPPIGRVILVTTEHDGLCLATLYKSTLHLLSRKAISDGGSGWKIDRFFELKTLLPDDVDLSSLEVVGFAEGVDVIFLETECGFFTFDIASIRVAKVSDKIWLSKETPYIFPYMSFYTPVGAASTVERSTAGAPSSST